jgi:hypothetical protein
VSREPAYRGGSAPDSLAAHRPGDECRAVRGARRGLACILLLVLGSSGCSLIGPASIRGSRSSYNDTIVATNNQQVLAMIVRTRYGEPSGLLAVSSITSNMKFQANAGSEFGFGSDTNYQGNLVPLSIGFAYEENPTITYTPVEGEKYMRGILSPLPVDLTLLLLNALRNSPQCMTLLVRSINGIRNPDFLMDPSVEVDRRFTRLAELLTELARQGRIVWAQEPGTVPSFALAISGEGEAFASQVGELYGLLGFAAPRDRGRVLTLPVEMGIGILDEPAIYLETRSLFDLLNIAAASVDVPEEHLTSGIAAPLPPMGLPGREIHIRRSKRRPDEALTAFRHHGWWYFIDGTDAKSERTFRIFEALLSVRIADTVDRRKTTPVLTVPVSR